MNKLRTLLAVIVLVLLTAGYGASQFAYMQGAESAQEYAKRVDSPAISHLALLLFLAIVILGFVRDRSPAEEGLD